MELAPDEAQVLVDGDRAHRRRSRRSRRRRAAWSGRASASPLDGVIVEGASSLDQSRDHRRVGAGRQGGRRRRLRRHAQRLRRAHRPRDRGRPPTRRSPASPRWSSEAQGSRAPVRALRRPLRADLHAARVRRRAAARDRSRVAFGGEPRHVALPRAGAADRRLPVLAGDLRPGGRRLRRRRRRPRRRADQGRRGAGGPRPRPRGRARQDRHAHRAARRSSRAS